LTGIATIHAILEVLRLYNLKAVLTVAPRRAVNGVASRRKRKVP
jgi:hypothetical protein